MLGFTTLIRVQNFLILGLNSLLRGLGNFRIKHVDNCGVAGCPKCGRGDVLHIFPVNSRETGNIMPETISRRTACRTRQSVFLTQALKNLTPGSPQKASLG